MPYEGEISPLKEEYVIRLERNDARMVRWMYNVRPEDRIQPSDLATKCNIKL